jgi:hypothetical protein
MKKSYCLIFLSMALIIITSSLTKGEIPTKELEEVPSDEIPSLIIGEWTMLDENNNLKVSLIFKDPYNYEMTEARDDGMKVSRKGEYKLYVSEKPYAIDLCLEKCGAPGSEWTTYFGIIRFLSKDEIEIRTSPSGTRPSEFNAADKEYTMILSRKK